MPVDRKYIDTLSTSATNELWREIEAKRVELANSYDMHWDDLKKSTHIYQLIDLNKSLRIIETSHQWTK